MEPPLLGLDQILSKWRENAKSDIVATIFSGKHHRERIISGIFISVLSNMLSNIALLIRRQQLKSNQFNQKTLYSDYDIEQDEAVSDGGNSEHIADFFSRILSALLFENWTALEHGI